MSNPVASGQIDTTSLNGNTAIQTRRGDGTFDNFLNRAIAQLDLAIMPLKFEFDFSTEKTEETPPQPKEERTSKAVDSFQTSNSEPRNEKMVILETKVIKQALIQHLPPLLNFPISINLSSSAGQSLTRENLQLVIDEIVKQARIFKLSRRLELNLDIESQELGKLLLTFRSKDGAIGVVIAAADAESRKLLDDHILELESALKEARITLDSVCITEIQKNKEEA